MEIIYSPKAFEDLKFWKRSGNKLVQKKIQELIFDIQKNPFTGIGKPEPLKHEHRLVYEVNEANKVLILSVLFLKGHH